MAVFWVVALCSPVEAYVSEVLAASIIRAIITQNTAVFILAAVKTSDLTNM
jgi:hypothetical protein